MSRSRRDPGIRGKLEAAADYTVGLFSPKRQFERKAARLMSRNLDRFSSSGYEAAENGRRWSNRALRDGSADAELDADTRQTLRDRSRDRKRNDTVAHAAIETLTDNVIGFGFRPRLRLDHEALGIDEDQAAYLADQATAIWDEWGENCDSANRLTIEDIQAQAFASMLVDGDCFVRPIMVQDARVRSRFDLKLEMIEGDRVDSPLGLVDPSVREGVVLGRRGQPVAYYVSREHPGDASIPGAVRTEGLRQFRRVPAHDRLGHPNILHLFHQERIGQSRGRPYLSIILNTLKDRGDYKEAEIIAAEVAACFAGFIKKADPWQAALARATADTKGKQERHEELSPGAMYYLADGEEVTFANPSRPSSVYGEFMKAITRETTSALGMPYEIAMRDFSGTTYSQARASMLEARRMFVRRQRWMVKHFLRPIWRLLLEEAWLKGIFEAGPDFLERVHQWTRAVWTPPSWGWVDPEKEAKAWGLMLEMGVTTREKIIASVDEDSVEAITEQQAREKRLREMHGLGTAVAAPSSDKEDEDDDDNDPPPSDPDDGDEGEETDDDGEDSEEESRQTALVGAGT